MPPSREFDRTDGVERKLGLLAAAHTAGRRDPAMSLADSIKDKLLFERATAGELGTTLHSPPDEFTRVGDLPAVWARRWSFAKANVTRLLTSVLAVLLLGASGLAQPPGGPTKPAPAGPSLGGPLTPERAPLSFQMEPGLRLELVAAEPLVASPVAMVFDERGRMYVA
jgi:hypothetical protein